MLIIIGALLEREYQVAGLIVAASAMGYYIVTGARQAWPRLKGFRTGNWNQRLRAGVWVFLVLALAGSLIHGQVSYFPVLLLFCADLLLGEGR